MKRAWLAAVITIVLIAVTYGSIPFILAHLDSKTAKAVQGALDLSQWRGDTALRLDGEWEFYPDRLLEPGALTGEPAKSGEARHIRVPDSWAGQMDVFGRATYRLRMYIPSSDALTYGLKTLSIQMSSRIFVNGQAVGGSGFPADQAAYRANNQPQAVYFPLQPGWNELLIQAANYDFPASGGINHPIYFGTAEQISRLHKKASAHDWIVFTAFLIIGLYFVGLFTTRRKDVFLLMFGLICLSLAAYSTTRGERIVYDLFDGMPIWLFLRLQMLSTLGASTAMFAYVQQAFGPFSFRRFTRMMLGVGAAMILIIVGWFDFIYNLPMLAVHSAYVSFSFVYATYVFMLAALNRVEGSLLLALAAVALNLHVFVQNLNVYFPVPRFIFPPVEPFIFLLMLSLLMSLRFSNAYKQIEQLSERLIRADELKDEFLTKTAHEFKTPLHGILHMIQSIADDKDPPVKPEHRERLEIMAGTVQRLSRLVYDIMDLSKLKKGEVAVHPIPIDVRSAVNTMLEVVTYIAAGKNIRLVNRIPDHLPPAFGDEHRFAQIIGNLLDNAVKYSEYGVIEVFAAHRGGMIEIGVKDTGIGMDQHDMEVIFEPFRSLNANFHDSFGLGLPIVKQLVEMQGGRIGVSSVKGEGTTFTFSLPAAAGSGQRSQKMALRPELGFSGEPRAPAAPDYLFPTPYVSDREGTHAILAVDDQYSNLKGLIDALERLDYRVIGVKNGSEALRQLASAKTVDLVILDLMLPGLSGFDVCKAIRDQYSPLELPVLMVTASIHPDDKIAAFRAGANDFLQKPFDAAELQARTASLLTMKDLGVKSVGLEVAFLYSQIKPHFLYNVLNTIMALSYTNPEQSRELIATLADFLRGSLSFDNIQSRVHFSKELELIRSYVALEQARFKDRIRVEYDIHQEVLDTLLPPLLIQPLVENAIRHGIGPCVGGGTITIKAYPSEQDTVIEVGDDGVGMSGERLAAVLEHQPMSRQDKTSGVGLLNIRKRLKFAYGTDLTIRSAAGGGTWVAMRIPGG